MEKRIELEKRGRKPHQIEELNLDNCRSTTIEGLTDDFLNLKVLSLNNVGLTSLKGFPVLPTLTKLELSDNRISSGLNLLSTSPNLTFLNLSGNRIKDLSCLEPLKDFKHLRVLDLFNNEVTSVENFREKTFKLIPTLKYLDGFDMKEEHEESEQEGDGEGDSVNGNEEEDFDEYEGGEYEEDENEDIEEEDELGLDAVYKDNLDEESEGDDYEGEGSEDEDEEIEDEEESSFQETEDDSTPRGKKRKHDGEEEVN